MIFARILYWLSLFGAALAMVAPLVFGGASYQEAQVAFILLLAATFALRAAAVPSRDAPPGVDPFAHAAKRRRARLAYWVAALVVLGFSSFIEFAIVYTELDRLRSAPGMSPGLDDVAAGSWTGVIGMGAAGLALLMTIVLKASRVPTAVATYAAAPSASGPYGHARAW